MPPEMDWAMAIIDSHKKLGEVRQCGFWDMLVDRKTDKHTDRHAHHSTLHPRRVGKVKIKKSQKVKRWRKRGINVHNDIEHTRETVCQQGLSGQCGTQEPRCPSAEEGWTSGLSWWVYRWPESACRHGPVGSGTEHRSVDSHTWLHHVHPPRNLPGNCKHQTNDTTISTCEQVSKSQHFCRGARF